MRLLPFVFLMGCFWVDTTGIPCEADDNCPYDTICEVLVDEETGERHCSAYDPFSPPQEAPETTLYKVSVEADEDHTCALRDDDTIVCWGDNDRGQLDAPQGRFASLDCGGRYCCAKPTTGPLECWGDDEYRGASDEGSSPGLLAVGDFHACATSGVMPLVRCWGSNNNGQLDIQPAGARDVAVSSASTCLVFSSGGVSCAGLGQDGVLSYDGFSEFIHLDGGPAAYCGITEQGELECFASSPFADTAWNDAPPTSDADYLQVDVGTRHVCAVDRDGEGACWGPGCVDDLCDVPAGPWSLLTAGADHTCGLRRTGELLCWGESDDGRLNVP